MFGNQAIRALGVQMPIMKVVDMVAMLNCRMPASSAMLMRMFLIRGHDCPPEMP
jgi:hypothetical protein